MAQAVAHATHRPQKKPSFWEDVSARMRRAVQQENRAIGTAKKGVKTKMTRTHRLCLFFLFLTPILLLFLFIHVGQLYHDLYQYEQEHQNPPQEGVLMTKTKEVDLAAEAKQMLRKREADVARIQARMEENEPEESGEVDHKNSPLAARKTLVLTTAIGDIRIQMKPEMSQESVDYIERLVASGECTRCSFYRAEQQGILQGVAANKAIPQNTVRGPCPPAAKSVKNDCPKWDLDCGCHGPVMIYGAVAWAGGSAGGPDFFINAYPKSAKWWGTQHTNFGFIGDKKSMDLVHKILHMPVKSQGGMHLLKDQVQFRLSLE